MKKTKSSKVMIIRTDLWELLQTDSDSKGVTYSDNLGVLVRKIHQRYMDKIAKYQETKKYCVSLFADEWKMLDEMKDKTGLALGQVVNELIKIKFNMIERAAVDDTLDLITAVGFLKSLIEIIEEKDLTNEQELLAETVHEAKEFLGYQDYESVNAVMD